VTPEDVVATLERHSDEKSKSAALGILQGIDKMKADGDEVVITLKEPNADFPYLMADYHLVIQPNGGKDNPNAGIGAGPYKVTVNEPGVRYGGEKFANYWQGDKLGHAAQVEIVVINDPTARTSALQGGQVHMINRVEPKIVDLVKRVPGVTIQAVAGRASIRSTCLRHRPLRQQRPEDGAEAGHDREDCWRRFCAAMARRQRLPDQRGLSLFSNDIEQRKFDPEKAAEYTRSRPFRLHPAAHLRRRLPRAVVPRSSTSILRQGRHQDRDQARARRRLLVGGVNKQPFSLSYWGGRPTQDQMYSTAYISSADWNDTRWKRPEFDNMVIAARAELDQDKRKKIYRDMAVMMRDEGGLIVPFFNQYIDATGKGVEGWVSNPAQEMCGGYALAMCWLAA